MAQTALPEGRRRGRVRNESQVFIADIPRRITAHVRRAIVSPTGRKDTSEAIAPSAALRGCTSGGRDVRKRRSKSSWKERRTAHLDKESYQHDIPPSFLVEGSFSNIFNDTHVLNFRAFSRFYEDSIYDAHKMSIHRPSWKDYFQILYDIYVLNFHAFPCFYEDSVYGIIGTKHCSTVSHAFSNICRYIYF